MDSFKWDQEKTSTHLTGKLKSPGALRAGTPVLTERFSDRVRLLFWLTLILVCVIGVAVGSRWLGAPELTAVAVSFALALVKLLSVLLETSPRLARRGISGRTSTLQADGDKTSTQSGQQSP